MKATFVGRGVTALGLFAATFALTIGMMAKVHATPGVPHCCLINDPAHGSCGGGGVLVAQPVPIPAFCQRDQSVTCYYDSISNTCKSN